LPEIPPPTLLKLSDDVEEVRGRGGVGGGEKDLRITAVEEAVDLRPAGTRRGEEAGLCLGGKALRSTTKVGDKLLDVESEKISESDFMSRGAIVVASLRQV